MNRDNQIEEMANDLAKICPDLAENCCGQINCVTHLTLSLSKMGYRKASDVAREIFEEIEKALEQAKEIADIRIRELAPHTYQVMREVGKLYCKHDSSAVAELKKKYTESEK